MCGAFTQAVRLPTMACIVNLKMHLYVSSNILFDCGHFFYKLFKLNMGGGDGFVRLSAVGKDGAGAGR